MKYYKKRTFTHCCSNATILLLYYTICYQCFDITE